MKISMSKIGNYNKLFFQKKIKTIGKFLVNFFI